MRRVMADEGEGTIREGGERSPASPESSSTAQGQ